MSGCVTWGHAMAGMALSLAVAAGLGVASFVAWVKQRRSR